MGRLGSVLGRQTSQSMVFNSIFRGFGLRLKLGNLKNLLVLHWFFKVFLVLVVFAINADIGWILVPTWLHFGAVWAPKTRLGSVLGHLGGVMGACWGVLGASWSFLGASWARLGRVLRCLGSVLGRLGDVLGASWKRLGSVLEKY